VDTHYDVIILGGAFSGASAAILLRREHPELRVLIVERATAFDEKVGEATTEMSAMFLTRRLAMWHHLEAEQLPKEGLRYWFANGKVTGHANASEAGGYLRSSVPSFQLRRDALDEHLLATAVREGAEILRPAKARDVQLGDFQNRVTVVVSRQFGDGSSHRQWRDPQLPEGPPPASDGGDETRELTCRWLLDATGRVNFIGRRLGLIERNDAHPTAAIWCRYRGVRHIDDLAARQGELAAGNISSRRLATNHYMGHSYWIWVIPLGNGETSVGVVFDKRIIDLHRSTNRGPDFFAFLNAIPSLKELLDGATPRLEDLRFYGHLPYYATQYMGKGWALLGDAASFLDPYYSPGLDHAAFSVDATVAIVGAQTKGEDVTARIEEHNAAFVRSYKRFFAAVFLDKYYYMGEHDLLAASFLLDTAHYYIFLVIPAYRFLRKFYWMPVLGPKPAFFSYHLMSFYNRRFKQIANARRNKGTDGLRNDGRRVKAYFNLNLAPFHMIARGLKLWLFAELDMVRLLFRGKKRSASVPSEPTGQREGAAGYSEVPVGAPTVGDPGRNVER
jgi:flavin-dependent dehydrogenase